MNGFEEVTFRPAVLDSMSEEFRPLRAVTAINQATLISRDLANRQHEQINEEPALRLQGRGGPGRGGAAIPKPGLNIFMERFQLTHQDVQKLILAAHTDWNTLLCIPKFRTWRRLKTMCPLLCQYIKRDDIFSIIEVRTGHIRYACHLSECFHLSQPGNDNLQEYGHVNASESRTICLPE